MTMATCAGSFATRPAVAELRRGGGQFASTCWCAVQPVPGHSDDNDYQLAGKHIPASHDAYYRRLGAGDLAAAQQCGVSAVSRRRRAVGCQCGAVLLMALLGSVDARPAGHHRLPGPACCKCRWPVTTEHQQRRAAGHGRGGQRALAARGLDLSLPGPVAPARRRCPSSWSVMPPIWNSTAACSRNRPGSGVKRRTVAPAAARMPRLGEEVPAALSFTGWQSMKCVVFMMVPTSIWPGGGHPGVLVRMAQ